MSTFATGWAIKRLVSSRLSGDREGSARVIAIVADAFGLTAEQMLPRARRRDVLLVRARQIAMAILREETGLSTPRLALVFGLADHTTVMHATKRVAELAASDPELATVLADIRALIRAQA